MSVRLAIHLGQFYNGQPRVQGDLLELIAHPTQCAIGVPHGWAFHQADVIDKEDVRLIEFDALAHPVDREPRFHAKLDAC